MSKERYVPIRPGIMEHLIRGRAESRIPVSVEAIARAENLARTLELFEVAA